MEKHTSYSNSDEFVLTSRPDVKSEVFLQAVLEDMVLSQPKRPLQCVTVKMPLPAYLRMKRAAQKWNLTYTDVINFCTQRVVPILESPSGTVAEMLEQHRTEGENKKAHRSRSKSHGASSRTLFDLS